MGEGQFCRDYMETVVALMHYQFNSPEILHSWLDLFLIQFNVFETQTD